jgi:oligopeptide transport system substrate-binding protein
MLHARTLCTLAALAGSLAACGLQASPTPSGELRVNIETGEPPTLDWNLATDWASVIVIDQLMRGLVRLDADQQPAPMLAERWESLESGRLWRFHLRRDVRWSDGEALVAQHFADSWLRLLAPETGAVYAYYLFPIRGARAYNAGLSTDPAQVGVRALDDHTLEVELETGLAFFPSLVNFMVTYPIRLDVIARHGERWTDPGNLVSLGPYVLREWRHDYRVALGANPRWAHQPGAPARVVFHMVGDPATQLVLLEQGRLDLVRLPPLEIRRYLGAPAHRGGLQLRGYYVGFNTRRPPFDDARVRRAFALALDREALVAVLREGSRPWGSWIPAGMFAANPEIGVRFDPGAARALLREAGVDPSRLGAIVYGFNSHPRHRLVAQKVQAMWREHLGVELLLAPREWKVYLKQLETDPPAVFRMGWGADYADPHGFMDLFTSHSEHNHTGWKHARYDALVEQAASESDPTRRRAHYDELQRILCEQELPIAPLFVEAMNWAVGPRLRGFEVTPMDQYAFDEVRVP